MLRWDVWRDVKIASGVDIVEIGRVQKSIEHIGEKFLETIYTEKEIQYCESHRVNKFQHYAARFAAKEALYKALSRFMDKDELNWKQFEIQNLSDGRPVVNIENEKIISIDLTMSHCKEYAVAQVVVLYNE